MADITTSFLEVPLFILATVVILSEKMYTFLFAHELPQKCTASAADMTSFSLICMEEATGQSMSQLT